MRILLGALIGCALATAVVTVLATNQIKGLWIVVPAALLAGLAMRFIASSNRVSYAAGALTALATVLGLIGGQGVAAKVIQSQKIGTSTEVSAAATDEVAEVVGAEPVEEDEPQQAARQGLGSGRNSGAIGAPRADAIKTVDVIWLAVGCLLAYQTGKGSGAGAVKQEGHQADGDAAADDGPADDHEENRHDES